MTAVPFSLGNQNEKEMSRQTSHLRISQCELWHKNTVGVPFQFQEIWLYFLTIKTNDCTNKLLAVRLQRFWCTRIYIAFSYSPFCFSKYVILNIMSTGDPPIPITPDYGGCKVRYADGVIDSNLNRYITVMEG